MYLYRIFILLFSVAVLEPVVAIECVSDVDLSNCSPSRNIILFSDSIMSTWVMHPDDGTYPLQDAILLSGACSKISACRDFTDLQNFGVFLSEFEPSGFLDCLSNYCQQANSSQFCCEEEAGMSYVNSSSVLITVMDESQIMAPSCKMELAQITAPVLDFICMYSNEYYGVEATLSMVAGQGELNSTCTNSDEPGFTKIENVSFSSLLDNTFEIAGNCSLQVPNIQQKPACNFSIYITPRISVMNVGESVTLTCPTYNKTSGLLKWWGIGPEGRFPLTISEVSDTVITFHATKAYTNGLAILCSLQSDDKQVLGIGKIFINESTTSSKSLNIDSFASIIMILCSLLGSKWCQ